MLQLSITVVYQAGSLFLHTGRTLLFYLVRSAWMPSNPYPWSYAYMLFASTTGSQVRAKCAACERRACLSSLQVCRMKAYTVNFFLLIESRKKSRPARLVPVAQEASIFSTCSNKKRATAVHLECYACSLPSSSSLCATAIQAQTMNHA